MRESSLARDPIDAIHADRTHEPDPFDSAGSAPAESESARSDSEQTGGHSPRIDPGLVASLYVEHSGELRNFLIGVLRDPELAGEVLQATFTRCVEVGHTAREETLKGWLFRVAFHEALAFRRRQGVDARAKEKLAWTTKPASPSADERLIRWESVEAVRAALEELPPEQRDVVRQRIYEEKTFAVIAAEQGLPLGTVLTRMRLAMEKLRKKLKT